MSGITDYYGDEVLSRRCMILFEMHDGSKQPFFGTVKEYKAKVKGDGSIDRSHFVVFDDGDSRWFDLSFQMSQQYMGWVDVFPKSDEARNGIGKMKVKSEQTENMKIVVLESSEEESGDETELPSRRIRSSKRHRGRFHSQSKISPSNSQPVSRERRLTRQSSSLMKARKREVLEKETTKAAAASKSYERGQFNLLNNSPQEVQTRSSASAVSPEKSGTEEAHCSVMAVSQHSDSSGRADQSSETTDDILGDDRGDDEANSDTSSMDEKDEDSKWLHDFESWVLNVPQGKNGKISSYSEANARKVIRQVGKLASGQGITMMNWPVGVYFYHDRNVDLSFDFRKMLQEVEDHESRFGKDKVGRRERTLL